MVTCQQIKDGERRRKGEGKTCALTKPRRSLADIEIPEVRGSKISFRETTKSRIERVLIPEIPFKITFVSENPERMKSVIVVRRVSSRAAISILQFVLVGPP